jgi:hypothetical protein
MESTATHRAAPLDESLVVDEAAAAEHFACLHPPSNILLAAEGARDHGLMRWDVLTPSPALGVGAAALDEGSAFPYIAFGFSCAGVVLGLMLQLETMVLGWPSLSGGALYAAWPSLVLVSAQLIALVAGVCCVLAMFVVHGLPTRTAGPLRSRPSRSVRAVDHGQG